VNVLIAGCEPKVRSAMRLLLDHEEGICVVGEVMESEKILSMVRDTMPDTIVLGLDVAINDVADLIIAIRSERPGIKVIGLSFKHKAREKALEEGVDAFVSKWDPPEELLSILRGT
jgi:DNA-binding NarL/FixJ family response regulator